jgi:hypothetical protein
LRPDADRAQRAQRKCVCHHAVRILMVIC